MRVVIAGGGTGGHIFPAISIAEEIISRSKNNEILFVGTRNGLEKEIVPKSGFNLVFINSGGIIGKGFVQKIKAVFSALHGLVSSLKIIRSFKPDIVLGVGGYVSGPTVFSAYLSFIPTAICEQNTVPGLTNRILSRFAKKIFLNFMESSKHFPEEKVVYTGNPIRSSFIHSNDSHNSSGKKGTCILILGGSQGASNINNVVPDAVSLLESDHLEIYHQTGQKDIELVENKYRDLKIKADVFSFSENIHELYKKSDLIISRSGAGTISEITAMGKPSVLIPFPYAAHNHQLFNAKYMEKAGASVIIEDSALDAKVLSDKIKKILYTDNWKKMAEQSKKLGKPDAAKQIVEELYTMVEK